jgi:hypothetical protein
VRGTHSRAEVLLARDETKTAAQIAAGIGGA